MLLLLFCQNIRIDLERSWDKHWNFLAASLIMCLPLFPPLAQPRDWSSVAFAVSLWLRLFAVLPAPLRFGCFAVISRSHYLQWTLAAVVQQCLPSRGLWKGNARRERERAPEPRVGEYFPLQHWHSFIATRLVVRNFLLLLPNQVARDSHTF